MTYGGILVSTGNRKQLLIQAELDKCSIISYQINANAEELSSFTFEDAMSFVGADYALAA